MNIDRSLPLLGGLSPRQFMQTHWQKKPLLVRAALPPGFRPPVDRSRLFELAARDDAEARLVVRSATKSWRLVHGPFKRRSLPALKTPGWTLLVQGVDSLDDTASEWLQQFRFVPDARLDDLMVSFASDGGGVGPHFDRYDVFLLQAQGRRRWRIGRQRDFALDPQAPLRILSNFRADREYVLDAGDMLYLPPRWAHEGDAVGACLTCSIGFRAPAGQDLAHELLLRLADAQQSGSADPLYRDPDQAAVSAPAAIPAALAEFGRQAVEALLRDPATLERALGEVLTEPKPSVWFENGNAPAPLREAVRLDRRTRMLYDRRHLFINGESLRATGRDARLLRRLADARRLSASDVVACSESARAQLAAWIADGWLHPDTGGTP